MAIEKRLAAVPAQAFTADGTNRGRITLVTTYPGFTPFKVKQKIVIKASGETNLELEIKRIFDDELTLDVGPRGGSISERTDLTAYTTASSATIEAEEQKRPSVPFEEYSRAVYEEEPISAYRIFSIDRWGNPWSTSNPFPTGMTFIRDGLPQNVLEDTVTPANNRPLPVKLTGFSGDVTINGIMFVETPNVMSFA